MSTPDRVWLVTGPNMGGKSTFLRQVAHIVVLAQVGSFVPAEAAVLGIVDRLFTRVGASDDVARDRSTFLVEMEEVAAILRSASAQSLVVVDEVGRGTSARDGLAIARAVLEHLAHHTRCRALFATHFHELGEAAEAFDVGCFSLGVEESEEGPLWTHRIQRGVAGRSFGLYVAERAGVPRSVLRRAAELLQEPAR